MKGTKSYFIFYITSILFVLQLFCILKFPSEASSQVRVNIKYSTR